MGFICWSQTTRMGHTDAVDVARGVCRVLDELGYATLTEIRVGSGRRVDVIGLDRRGHFAIVEIKVSPADLRADRKWPEYLRHCDRFYFGVPIAFPQELLPEECGIIVADRHGGAVVRDAPVRDAAVARMAAPTRRALTLRFARTAASRLRRIEDAPI